MLGKWVAKGSKDTKNKVSGVFGWGGGCERGVSAEKKWRSINKLINLPTNKKNYQPTNQPINRTPHLFIKHTLNNKVTLLSFSKVRVKADMASKEVAKVLGGQEVNVAEEDFVTKADGTKVQRLRITAPKSGWVTAQNFEQK